MAQQQTVLKVQTNRIKTTIILPDAEIPLNSTTGITISGSGSTLNPYTSTSGITDCEINFTVKNFGGVINFEFSSTSGTTQYEYYIRVDGLSFPAYITQATNSLFAGYFEVQRDQVVQIYFQNFGGTSQLNLLYIQTNTNENTVYEYDKLDTYTDIPIKIHKSFSEIQDINKKNSDYSIGLKLPGSKQNNRFFESIYNVDARSLYFDVSKRTPCEVTINDEKYFTGFLRLNKINVQNSSVEYDVTLYSTIGDLFGKIGNNLLKDLDYSKGFNHYFNLYNVTSWSGVGEDYYSIFGFNNPPKFFYPIVHNGYEYNTGNTVNLSGGTTASQTRLYTSTIVGSYSNNSAAYSAGVQRYRINSPEDGLLDNQLKPALHLKSLIELMFNDYGYKIKSDFFNTPWFKLMYLYGYFSSDQTKFGYRVGPYPVFPIEDVTLYLKDNGDKTFSVIVVKEGTGTPVQTDTTITVQVQFYELIFTFPITYIFHTYNYTIQPNQSIITENFPNNNYFLYKIINSGSTVPQSFQLDYTPSPVNSTVPFVDGDFVNFALVVDDKIKQIDLLSSIAKKFNLVFIPDPDVPNQIIVEPFQYYIGTGNIYDWTNKLSYDRGFSVEPALNYIESDLYLSDLEDGDFGNQEFKNRNNRIYGENYVYNPTDFKSQEKRIQTIFSPEILRKWDTSDTAPNGDISLPLGINYAFTTVNGRSGASETVFPQYKGIKTKPKIFYYLGVFSPFSNLLGEVFTFSGNVQTNQVNIMDSDGTTQYSFNYIPVISHTMPVGNTDENKINNDSICSLFKCQESLDIGVSPYNAFSENDIYSLFYANRINNLYNFNTRFIKGYFDLNNNDIKNLKPNDIIKINEQYFTWNKIDGYNLINPELTSVELVQFDKYVNEYPTRYFQYFYCSDPNTIYRFKTDMTNPALRLTNYGWSITYDYYIGTLTGGTKTGYTSTIQLFDGINQEKIYYPYYIYEVSETTYNSSGIDRSNDPIWSEATGNGSYGDLNSYNFPNFIITSGGTSQIFNVFEDCNQFNNYASTYDILTGTTTGSTPSSFSSGITINVTTFGYVRYTTPSGPVVIFRTSTGSYTITECANCDTVQPASEYTFPAVFTITSCGTPCP